MGLLTAETSSLRCGQWVGHQLASPPSAAEQLLALRLLEAGPSLPHPSAAQLVRNGLVICFGSLVVGTIASALSALVLWVPIRCWCRAMVSVLEASGLRRRYDTVGVLDASINVAACESVAVLGRQGLASPRLWPCWRDCAGRNREQ